MGKNNALRNEHILVVKPAIESNLEIVKDETATVAAEATDAKVFELPKPPVVEAPVVVKEEPRKLTLDEKIQKVEDLTLLIERFKALAESRRKLQTFHIGADSMSSTIQLRDASGNEFKTSNSAVITTVIEEMKRTLDLKVREVETQINF
jgi:hypothetical protein